MEGEPAGPIVLDGSHGEGGGQIVRSALALAVVCRRPVVLTRIRAGRPKPGLRPQHLAVVRALAEVADAAVTGDAIGSSTLEFAPRGVRGGRYRFDIGAETGSAGSTTLLFQALLLPLTLAGASSQLTLLGGTHVPWSPPVHYLTEVFLPALGTVGVRAHVRLGRWGWYPAGGGELDAGIEPARGLEGFRPRPRPARATGLSAVSRLPRSIAERQRRRAEERLAAAGVVAEIAIEEDSAARGPGTFLFLAEPGRGGFSALGRRGLPAERVADEAADGLLAFQVSGSDVDAHLADQLLPFLALAGRASTFTCPVVSSHLRTVAWVVQRFVSVQIAFDEGAPSRVRITPGPAGSASAGPAAAAG